MVCVCDGVCVCVVSSCFAAGRMLAMLGGSQTRPGQENFHSVSLYRVKEFRFDIKCLGCG